MASVSFAVKFGMGVRALKPVDWLMLLYMVISTPALFLPIEHGEPPIWSGIVVRILVIPCVIYWRYYLATTHPECFDSTYLCVVAGKVVTWCFPVVVSWVLDVYALLVCIYCYAEDGAIIHGLYGNSKDHPDNYWDRAMQQVDVQIFHIDPSIGLGATLRNATSETVTKVAGEYMSFCYFAFYGILGGTWLLAWLFIKREYFDRVATAQVTVYLLCVGLYLVFPTEGPFWTYTPPEPGTVGYLFSYINHKVVSGASAKGTAFPSCHCAMTTAAFLVSLAYMRPLGLVYIGICPGLIFGTIFLGFHYGVDALVGVSVGLISVGISAALCRVLPYRLPICDKRYSEDIRNLHVLVDEESLPLYGEQGAPPSPLTHISNLTVRSTRSTRSTRSGRSARSGRSSSGQAGSLSQAMPDYGSSHHNAPVAAAGN